MDRSSYLAEPLATGARCDETHLWVDLSDGRTIGLPLAWFPRLLAATPAERANLRLIAGGVGIHWEKIDEDLSVRRLLYPSPPETEPASALYELRSSSAQGTRDKSVRNLSAWTFTTVLFWLLMLPVTEWTVSWWEQRSHVVLVMFSLTTVTLYLWVRFLWRRSNPHGWRLSTSERAPK